ncbi:MAG: DMT family transporter [Actinomycetota bacterium]
MTRRTELVGIGFALIAAVSFGTLAIFAKYAYEEGAEAVPLLAVRFTVTALLLIAYVAARKGNLRVGRAKIGRLLALGALGYGVESTFFFMALERAPASIVGLVFYSFPLWTTLLALSLKLEHFDKKLLVALLLGTIGVGSIFSITSTSLAGPLFALAAAIVVAMFYISAQVLTADTPSSVAATWTAIGAAGALWAVAAIMRAGLPMAALGHAVLLGVATAIAFITMYAAIVRIGSSRAAIANMAELVTTIILAALLLGEDITVRIAIGALLVLSAIPILAFKRTDRVTAADAP